MSLADFEAAVARLRERVATVHERVACPRCGAPVGVRCVHAGTARGGRADLVRVLAAPALKHPHRERLRADGIPDR